MRAAASAPSARASASGSARARASCRAVASAGIARRQFSDPLLAGGKAASELSQPPSAIPRWRGSGLGPRRGRAGAAIQAAWRGTRRQRREVQGGEAERERAGAFVPPGAGDLLLPEVEEAPGERRRVVVIARAPAHGASIADAAARSLTWPAPPTMLGP